MNQFGYFPYFIQISVSCIYYVVKQKKENHTSRVPAEVSCPVDRLQMLFFSNFIVRAGQPFVIVIIRQTLKHEQLRKLSSSEDFKLFSKTIYAGSSKCVSSNEHSQMYAKAWTKLSERK